jgi:hypothetical protein
MFLARRLTAAIKFRFAVRFTSSKSSLRLDFSYPQYVMCHDQLDKRY